MIVALIKVGSGDGAAGHWEELVNYKLFSILLSFAQFAWAFCSIR